MADGIATLRSGRNLKEIIRYVLGAAIGIVVLVLLFGRRSELIAAWHQLSNVSVGWVLAAIVAEATSLYMFAYLQQRVLRLSGAKLRMPGLYLLTMANDAISNTVPGEPAVSSAYRYRYYRRCGATGAAAGWTIFTILIAQAIAMSLLLLIGVVLAIAGQTSGRNTGVAVVGLVIVLASGAVLVRRDLVLRLAERAVRGVRRLTGHPRGNVGERIASTLARMREIPLSPRSTVAVVALGASVWIFDFATLVCAFGAVRAEIPWAGVLLAYCVSEIAASLPIVPGGIGIVEGSLAVILTAYGTNHTSALSIALVFRFVSWWLAIGAGWAGFGVLARQARGRAVASALTRQADPVLPSRQLGPAPAEPQLSPSRIPVANPGAPHSVA